MRRIFRNKDGYIRTSVILIGLYLFCTIIAYLAIEVAK